MNSETWKTFKLASLCTKIGSGATPRGGKETYQDVGPYTLIRSQNVLDFFLSKEGLAYINEKQATQLNNVDVKERDILLNITGDSVARVCQVSKELLPARVNQHVSIIRPDVSRLNPEFLKYYLLNPKFKNHMLGLASVGGTRNALTKGMIEDFSIQVPPLPTQRRIAEILTALDDKIELNRQTNATLEAIAQAIFKEWFVDFNFPGATGEMVESELGMIPEGWKVGKLGEMLNFRNGKSSPERKTENRYPVYGANGIIGFATTFNSRERNIVIGRVGSFCGSVHYTLQKTYVTDNAIIAEPIQVDSSTFCFTVLQKMNLNSFKVGSGQPLINQSILSGIEIIIPEVKLLKWYEELILPFYKKMFENDQQSTTLAIIRDGLLPKLMNGEIEI